MKKIMVMLMFILISGVSFGQFGWLKGNKKIQNPANIKRVYVHDYPVTDSIKYRDVLPGSMRVVTAFTAGDSAKHIPPQPVFMLTDSSLFEEIKSWFEDSLYQEKIKTGPVAFEFVVSYMKQMSWLKKSDIQKLGPMQKLAVQALNENEKFTAMAQGPKHIRARRDELGNIWPIFDDIITIQTQPNKQSSTSPDQTQKEKKSSPGWGSGTPPQKKKTGGLKPAG